MTDASGMQLRARDVAARGGGGAEAAAADERRGALLRTACCIVASAVCYYVATRIAWALCFPDSKVSLFFPPHAIAVAILLLVPTRHWWAYVLATAGAHFLATQQAHWPPLYALTCEAFDAAKALAAAAGIRLFIRSPLKALTLRDVVVFILIAVVLVPFGAAFWGAAFTVSNRFGTRYWIEWRNLGISNAVTAVVLVPALLLGAYHLFIRRPRRPSRRCVLEASFLVAGTIVIGLFVFDATPAGPNTSPALLYTPIPLLIWAALRFGLAGISVSMLLVTCLSIWGTMNGHGPFLAQTPVENALALQLFLLVTATPLMLLAVVIEEERRSKEALRESKDLMSLAAEAANMAMWASDVSGSNGSITERRRLLLNFKPDARTDHATAVDAVHPEDVATREHAIKQALETHGEYEMEYRVQQQPGGAVRWINARGRCVEADDTPGLKLFGVSMDVTSRKQAEAVAAREHAELQQQRAQLEHLARVATLGELTATITHELKQPLSAIGLNASVGVQLLDKPAPDLAEVRAALTEIRDTTNRAGNVIEGLRAMLKRDTAGFAAVDLHALIRLVERIVHSDAVQHRVKVQLDFAPDLPPVNGDAVQLQQVMLNLMLNAFAAMDAVSPDPYGARRLVVRSTSPDAASVLIEVSDTGTGISPDKLENIFDPFVTSKPQGLGMGLSICRTIIERHGGRLRAANNEGGSAGATFSITLPTTPVGA